MPTRIAINGFEAGERELSIDGRPVRALAEPEVSKLPWAELGVDVVIESTGRHRTRAAAAGHGPLQGLLSCSEEEIVSADIVGSPYSAIFDAQLTSVVGGTQVKVLAWYDNEWGYSSRLAELAGRVLAPVPAGA